MIYFLQNKGSSGPGLHKHRLKGKKNITMSVYNKVFTIKLQNKKMLININNTLRRIQP